MSKARVHTMWWFILFVVVALLFVPHHDDISEPADRKTMTPAKVARVQYYVGMEMLIVAICMVGGAITIRSAVMRLPERKNALDPPNSPQEDAKPSVDEPLLVLTDEQGKFVV